MGSAARRPFRAVPLTRRDASIEASRLLVVSADAGRPALGRPPRRTLRHRVLRQHAVNAVAHAVHRVVLPVVVGLGGLLVWALILVVAVPLGALVALVGWTADQVWERS